MRSRRTTGGRHAIPVACALFLALSLGPRFACAAAAPVLADTAERVRTLVRWARESVAEESVESRQRAMRSLDEALRLQPANPEVWFERGRVYERGALEKEARNCYGKAIALAPRDPEPYVSLGLSWKRLWLRRLDATALDSAIICLRRATDLRPYDSRTWLRLVPLLYERGDPAGAALAAERALARRPMYGDGRLARAYLAYRRGEVETADSAFTVALPLLSADERARFADLAPIIGLPESEQLAAAGGDSLRRFWQRLDPDPTSRENELKLEYWSRVAHALLLFEDPLHPQWDARADTYLRYGPPQGMRLNPPGTPLYFKYAASHPGPHGMESTIQDYALVAEAWDYPELGMRVLLQDRSLTGRYEQAVARDFDPLSAPDPRVLAHRGDLVALDGGLAVFPTLPPAAQRIDLRGTLVRFEGARGPRLFVQVQAPGAPGDTLWARCAVFDARGREVSRDATALGLSLCRPTERRIAEFSAELPAGAYDVTVSVRDPHHKRGLVRIATELSPPPQGLDLSDVVLTCGTPEALTSGGSVRLESNFERRVPRGAPLVVYFEIYRLTPGADGLARFEYEYTVRRVIESTSGKVRAAAQASLASTSATRVEIQLGALRRQFVTVPAQSLTPGRYRLEVRVRDLVAGTQAERSLEFEKE
jgi:GWxTD domain-containing protein